MEQSLHLKLVHFFVLLLIIYQSKAQRCLNHEGQAVDWWIKLMFPKEVPSGYAYFDSTYEAPSFVVFQEEPDDQQTPLTSTVKQLNSKSMNYILWNDQTPQNDSSSSKAHSKTILSFSSKTHTGFIISHSIPKFPSIINDKVNEKINQSQKIYGQHALCISIDNQMFYQILARIMPIRPQIYGLKLNQNQNINQIFQEEDRTKPDYCSEFTTFNFTTGNTNIFSIYKNGGINASIFEDGLNLFLQSPLLAETWGRPSQDPWCDSQFNVGNIQSLTISDDISWKRSKDHSKWVYAIQNDYSCFGDMNRMSSQWKRGGAFYCLNSPQLNKALSFIIDKYSNCQPQCN